MSGVKSHPEQALLDYINLALPPDKKVEVERHLEACSECRLVAAAVAGAKEAIAPGTEPLSAHPDLGELASFFYGRPVEARRSAIAAHVAACRECGEAMAIYARSERAAENYNVMSAAANKAPASAWDLIRNWENSGVANTLTEGQTLGGQRLSRLLSLLREHRDEILHAESRPGLVPVMVVSRNGEFRRIEIFEKTHGTGGEDVLEHAGRSEQFHARQIHAIVQLQSGEYAVVSEKVQRYKVKLHVRGSQTGYFIVEDSEEE